jgi:multicomponent Na+:H+ antiporter subunit G
LTTILDVVGLIFLWIGVGFSVLGILGLIRLPDMYTRLHATGKVSTVGLCSILLGAAFLMPSMALKLIALAIFAVLTMPVSTHVIAAAGYRAGLPMATFSRDDLAGQIDDIRAKEVADEKHPALEKVLQHGDRLP